MIRNSDCRLRKINCYNNNCCTEYCCVKQQLDEPRITDRSCQTGTERKHVDASMLHKINGGVFHLSAARHRSNVLTLLEEHSGKWQNTGDEWVWERGRVRGWQVVQDSLLTAKRETLKGQMLSRVTQYNKLRIVVTHPAVSVHTVPLKIKKQNRD